MCSMPMAIGASLLLSLTSLELRHLPCLGKLDYVTIVTERLTSTIVLFHLI